MFGKHDFAGDLSVVGDDSYVTKPLRPLLQPTKEKLDDNKKIRLGVDFLRPKDGFSIPKPGTNSQELTLSYLCEMGDKGKEVAVNSDRDETSSFVERDFLSLSDSKGNSSSSKREAPSEEMMMIHNTSAEKKKSRLNLSLALPDVSLSNDFSNDFTMSCSYSHPFSHNPSCSMTRNSTENYDYSHSQSDKIWCAGEGTNGSVHSRFRPLGDGGVGVSCFPMMRETRQPNNNKDSSTFRSLYRTASCSENTSSFPSELQARPQVDNNLSLSGDSRRRGSEDVRVLESVDGGRMRKTSPAERLVREIVSESVPVMAQKVEELSVETIESVKEYLRNLIEVGVKKEEFLGIQNLIERRSDLTKETLLKCHKDQLAVLVAVRMGLKRFLSEKVQVSMVEMVEIFLYTRCRNLNCKNLLPIDDCDCKICSGNNGFCSSCMCPVCLQFDCAENTCSWVGCDVCSHWCHARCGMEKNLIRPAPSLKGPSGTTELQFHCIGCGHTSEMFGFVKDVFLYCAKNWGLETLAKELDCVKNIFSCSDDQRGKKLYLIADGLVKKLQCRSMSPSDACDIMFRLFNNIDCVMDISVPGTSSSKEPVTPQANLRRDELSVTPPKYAVHNTGPSPGQADIVSNDVHKKELRSALMKDLKTDDAFQFGRLCKSDGFDSLESMVRIKEAEARMFQSKADEAQREAEGFKRLIQARMENLEEEYSEKLRRLCLQETEEKRRNKVEELKALENSQCDYYKMKLRMQREIAGLLERMEATKQQWV